MAASYDRHRQQQLQQQRQRANRSTMAFRPPSDEMVDDCASSSRSTYTGAATNTTNQGGSPQVGPPQLSQLSPPPPPPPVTPTIKTIQGDGVKLTIVKPNPAGPESRPKRQPVCLKIRTTRKFKQAQQQSQQLANADRDSATRDSVYSVHSGITSKLEKIMENQLVKFPYPLETKCLTFLEKYPTFTGTYSLESSLGSNLVEQLMEQMHWPDKSKLTEMAISRRSNHLVWRHGFSANNALGSAAYPEETIISRINSSRWS